MNANKHNESNESEEGAATSFGKLLGKQHLAHLRVSTYHSKSDRNAQAAETMMYSHCAHREGEDK